MTEKIRITDEIVNDIYRMHVEGYTNNQIAEKKFGSTYYEYSVRRALKKYQVKECGEFSVNDKELNVLFFDIETSPCVSYHFGHWNINVRQEHKIKESHLLTVSYAFNDGPIIGKKINIEDIENGDDLTILIDIIDAINNADVVVGYNSKRFDLKYINTRALYYGLAPLKPVKHIDLYEQIKKQFLFPSNSMDNVSKYLGLEGKLKHAGFIMWANSMNHKSPETCIPALNMMLDYNVQDIEATRVLYKLLQGWFKQIPNLGVIKNIKSPIQQQNVLRCSKCTSDDILPLENQYYYTNTKGFQLYRCKKCNGVSRISKSGLVGCL